MKQIPKSYFVTILDRLTRFEPAYIRYKRVFNDIINKFAPDLKNNNSSVIEECEIVANIINNSLTEIKDDIISPVMYNLEKKYFKFNEVSYQYLSARLNLSSILNEIEKNSDLPKNILWLKKISKNSDLNKLRKEFSLLYPIDKILLCEGETEKILLSTLAKLFGVDFDKEGIMLVAPGGKNQVARRYYSLTDDYKLPIYILLDKDAMSVKELIDAKLRPNDKIYLINSGEFEDLIPPDIIINTINYAHNNDIHCISDDFNKEKKAVINIEDIYRKYGFGEFKKAHFARLLKEYIEINSTKDDFKTSEIKDIVEFLKD